VRSQPANISVAGSRATLSRRVVPSPKPPGPHQHAAHRPSPSAPSRAPTLTRDLLTCLHTTPSTREIVPLTRRSISVALRQQAWERPPQSCGPVSLPPDAAVQQQPQPVVGEVTEPVPDALHLLDEQVQRLGGPVGAAAGGLGRRGSRPPRPARCEPAEWRGVPAWPSEAVSALASPGQGIGRGRAPSSPGPSPTA
jgi:hypothetical protein